ncbi:hypothetical protein C171_19712 [Paenibacillus sp. FSL H8-237]|uniref:Uncharacterized protein n=1 Tax=Paenibacillus odorifer TaxID=189426 RepID=A0A1R0X0J0_9BACL|nr:hypothetical protein C171_19712 [Paenibacillus sp. FSL H8-237]OMD25419.1 hypothetical protein BJP51_03985 [Paenibacillus odorifer]OME55174.1 hypothetical protein BSK61_13995 [Paenibacillus odorifer]
MILIPMVLIPMMLIPIMLIPIMLIPIMLDPIPHPRLADSDGVIYVFYAFGAQFRTPVTLLHRKRILLGAFHGNSCDGVR